MMKTALIFLFCFCSVNSVKFKADDVSPATSPFSDIATNLKEVFAARAGNVSNIPEAHSAATTSSNEVLLQGGSVNAFVETVHIAYALHYPLVISPDDVWLCIMQGFAAHVNENAEELRHMFVNFDGKKELEVRRDNFIKGSPNNYWPGVFTEFSSKIRENIGSDTHDLLVQNFTTTGLVEKSAAEIVLMNTVSKYFDYTVQTTCGIPEIELRGTVDDWKELREKTLALAQYDLSWWTEPLKDVLDQFVAASQGDIDRPFWRAIYKQFGDSGGPYITGWIINFFPYLQSQHGGLRKNIYMEGTQSCTSLLTSTHFTSGVSAAPFIWKYHDLLFPMNFNAGFMGTKQNQETLAVSTVIGWSVTNRYDKGSLYPIYSNRGDIMGCYEDEEISETLHCSSDGIAFLF